MQQTLITIYPIKHHVKRKGLFLFDQQVSYAPVILTPKILGLRITFFLLLFLFTDLDFVSQIIVLGNMSCLTTSHDYLKVQYRAVQLFLQYLRIQGRLQGKEPLSFEVCLQEEVDTGGSFKTPLLITSRP